MASVVLALAVVGVSGALIASSKQTAAQQDDAVSISLGRQLMEEIVALPIVLPDGTTGDTGWPGVTNRDSYDSVDDYHGYTDTINGRIQRGREDSVSAAASALPASTVNVGTPDPLNREEYRRTVSVTLPTSLFGTTVNSGDFAIVQVAVTSASGSTVRLNRLVSRVTITR